MSAARDDVLKAHNAMMRTVWNLGVRGWSIPWPTKNDLPRFEKHNQATAAFVDSLDAALSAAEQRGREGSSLSEARHPILIALVRQCSDQDWEGCPTIVPESLLACAIEAMQEKLPDCEGDACGLCLECVEIMLGGSLATPAPIHPGESATDSLGEVAAGLEEE